MYQPSEIADLILCIALGPVIVVALRRATYAVPVSAWVALSAMFVAYTSTVAEGFLFPDIFNVIEHVSYAVAGVAFVHMLIAFRRTLAGRARQAR